MFNHINPATRYLSQPTYREQDNPINASSETEESSSDLDEESVSAKLASKAYTKQIKKLNTVNHVSCLVNQLNESNKENNQDNVNILATLINAMTYAFLSKNFISASTIAEINDIKFLLNEEFERKVENKFQAMLHFSFDEIDKFITNKIDKIPIFYILRNMSILIKYTQYFGEQENNILKVIISLKNIIQNINLFEQRHQNELNISISKILIEIPILKPEQKFSIFNFKEPLQKLFCHFLSLQKNSDHYLSYRANYTCQALIDIYTNIEFYKNEDDSSEITKHRQRSWYLNLHHIHEIEKSTFNNIDDLLGKLSPTKRELFLYAAYEILINKIFNVSNEKNTKEKIFNFLRDILVRDKSIIKNDHFLNHINLPSEEILFWGNPLRQTRQRMYLNQWLSQSLHNREISSRRFLLNFENIISNPIFSSQQDSNYLIQHAKRILIKDIKQKIYRLNKSYKLDIKSSEFYYFRHMKNVDKEIEEEKKKYRYSRIYTNEEPLYRNIASFKYRQKNGKAIYFLAYSMGKMGKVNLPFWHLANNNWNGGRGHSEALLLATHEVGRARVIGQGERILNFAGVQPEYCATTNSPCSTGETCKEDLILPSTVYAHRYKGPADNDGFQQKLWKHKNKIEQDESYTSEVESEEEPEAFVIDKQYFKDLDLSKVSASRLNPVTVWPFHDYIREKRPDYYAKYLADSSEKKFFASYVSFKESNDEIQPIQRNERTTTQSIKIEGDLEEITAALKNTGLA